jgi:branched-chain amino acid transport system ATP-binding protein
MKRLSARLSDYLAGESLFPILVLFLLNAVDEFDTRIFEVLGPDVAKSFHIEVGAFTAIVVFSAVIVPLVAIPVASAADRRARMPIAIAGAAAWGSFSVMTGLAPVLAVLFLARAGSSMGKVVNGPVHYGLIGDFYSPRSRTKVFGIHSLANPVGGVIAAVVAGALADAFGWRMPFILFGIPTVLAILVARRLAEPERGRFEPVTDPEASVPIRQAVRELWQLRSLRYQWIGAAWAGGAVFGIGVLLPFFLKDEFGVGATGRGVINASAQIIAVLATLVGTKLMQDRINETPSQGLRLLSWTGVAAAISLVVGAIAPNLIVLLIPLFVVVAVFALVVPGLAGITALVAPPELRSMAFAVGGLVALAGLPFALVGGLIGNASLRWALAVMSPIFLRGVVYFFQAARYLDDDIARLDPATPHAGVDDDIVLSVRDLTVSYGPVQVLFGVNLEVRRGEIVALLGTNGSGKSTILNAVSGLVEPTGGNVWFDGDFITTERPERVAARGLVQAPGGKGVFPALSVEENLRMAGFLLRRDAATLEARLAEVFELFPRLAERRKQRAGDLSGGERQMLTIAGAFLLHPKLLMIDELSLGLAPAVVQELLRAVRAMNATGTTIVIVEQSVNVALTLADHAYFLEKGEVRFDGRTADLLKRDDLVRSVFLEGAAKAVKKK